MCGRRQGRGAALAEADVEVARQRRDRDVRREVERGLVDLEVAEVQALAFRRGRQPLYVEVDGEVLVAAGDRPHAGQAVAVQVLHLGDVGDAGRRLHQTTGALADRRVERLVERRGRREVGRAQVEGTHDHRQLVDLAFCVLDARLAVELAGVHPEPLDGRGVDLEAVGTGDEGLLALDPNARVARRTYELRIEVQRRAEGRLEVGDRKSTRLNSSH